MLCVAIRIASSYDETCRFHYIKRIFLNYPKSAAIRYFSKNLKDEFETAVVKEPLVFEPLKFYCIFKIIPTWIHFKNKQILFYLFTLFLPYKHGSQSTKVYLCNDLRIKNVNV